DRLESRHVAQHGPGGALAGTPGLGERDAAPHPPEEHHAEFVLELADRLGHRWLSDSECGRGAREAAVIDHADDEFDLPKIHRWSLCDRYVRVVVPMGCRCLSTACASPRT